eukprot:1186826-Pyramimonas_sp.AAC.1
MQLVRENKTSAPTLSQSGKVVAYQLLASRGFQVQIGDVEGAFLEADPVKRKNGDLHLKQPRGGLPGLHPDQLLK